MSTDRMVNDVMGSDGMVVNDGVRDGGVHAMKVIVCVAVSCVAVI